MCSGMDDGSCEVRWKEGCKERNGDLKWKEVEQRSQEKDGERKEQKGSVMN